jgi:hypothetical protein
VEYAEKWVEYWVRFHVHRFYTALHYVLVAHKGGIFKSLRRNVSQGLDIRTKSDVTVVRENHEGDHKFTLEVVTTGNDDQEAISETRCKWVLAGTGFWQGHTPDIDGMKENSIHYNDMPSEMAPYSNKTIAIIGAGNAGFETFKAVMGEAAYVHLHSPSPLKLAWETHYVGHLRSVNVIPIDNYQLKSQDLLMIPSREIGTGRDDTIVEKEWIDGKEKSCLNSKNGAPPRAPALPCHGNALRSRPAD